MSTKAKIKIFTGIAVLLAIVVAVVAYCGRERQIPTDIGCFPHIKRICVGGEYFTFDEGTRRGEAPAPCHLPQGEGEGGARNFSPCTEEPRFAHCLIFKLSIFIQSQQKSLPVGRLFCCDRKISRVL